LRGFCCGEGRRELTQGVDAKGAGAGESGARQGGAGGEEGCVSLGTQCGGDSGAGKGVEGAWV